MDMNRKLHGLLKSIAWAERQGNRYHRESDPKWIFVLFSQWYLTGSKPFPLLISVSPKYKYETVYTRPGENFLMPWRFSWVLIWWTKVNFVLMHLIRNTECHITMTPPYTIQLHHLFIWSITASAVVDWCNVGKPYVSMLYFIRTTVWSKIN